MRKYVLLAATLALAPGALARDRLYKTCSSPIPVIQKRLDIPGILEQESMLKGAELGVLHGTFARETLERWPSAIEYVLVDLWSPQENYKDLANAAQNVQDQRMNDAISNTRQWSEKIRICRNYTTVCATRYPEEYFDYLYVDARHDRKGVLEDLDAWWPKMRADGLICGHDYVTQDEGPQQSGQDWTKNYDGTIDESRRAVRGAVDDWAKKHKRQVQVTYREADWPSWCIRR